MNAGDTGFMLICSALVFFMTPGLAFFYGGLVRRKNVVSTMMACAAIIYAGLSVVGSKKECRQHHDGMRSDYGIVGCHVGIVWIFTVFWWKLCRNYWRFPVVWLAWN